MTARQYIREIVLRSCLPARERKRLKTDLENEINAALERGESIEQIMERMGDPDTVAAEIYENYSGETLRPFREYKSKRTLFGLPLVHIVRMNYGAMVPNTRVIAARGINIGGRYGYLTNFPTLPTARGVFAFGPKARGILAVGRMATGIFSIGNISAGLISIGNISAGLLSIGNFALALLIALGNFAAGLLSAGNMTLGYGVAGNMALGEFAIGNYVVGTHTFSISNLYTQLESVKLFFRELEAPMPVTAFFRYIEGLLEVLVDPIPAIPYLIIFFSILLIAILALCIVPNRLLNRNPHE
jgi:hypothetical protein